MREALILIMVAVALGQAPAPQPANAFETRFADGGVVRFKLASGDYTLQAGTGDRIVLRWLATDSADEREMRKIKAYADINGSAAIIRTDGPTKKARIAIEIPAHTDIFIRLRGGDVRIRGIEGNKDVSMTAGDLKIDLEPESYAHVHASVTIGDLRGQALGISRDGFRNSFDWDGSGKYYLRASLFAGDLTLDGGQRRSR
jgi:phage baseplate assembly protein gpV